MRKRKKETEMDNEKDELKDEEKEKPEDSDPVTEPDDKEEEPTGKEKKKLHKQLKELEAKLQKAEKEQDKAKETLAEANDKYLRMLAEFDNYKKRTAKESEAKYSNAYCDAVEALLPVFDNIERAADYASDEQSKNGLLLIISNFKDVLSKMGVEQFGEVGDEFNADIHSAVMHIEDENLGENTIAEVFQKGYKKGDKIIRYATVKVAN